MVVENLSKLPNSSIYDKIREVAPQLFDFDFEIWDETHKLELETKIISHYLNYEIGLETLGLWKFYLQQKMNEIMPYYNEVAKSLNLDFDILKDVDYQEEFSGNEVGEETDNTTMTNNSTSSGNDESNSSVTSKNIHSDYPQARVYSNDYATTSDEANSSENSSATTNSRVNSDGSSDSSKNSKKDNTYTKKIKGKMGGLTYPEMILNYRKQIINIDMLIIDELRELFMLIW